MSALLAFYHVQLQQSRPSWPLSVTVILLTIPATPEITQRSHYLTSAAADAKQNRTSSAFGSETDVISATSSKADFV